MTANHLYQNVTNPFGDAPIVYLPQTGSTMDDADRLLETNPVSGTIVVAGRQTAGRGRKPGRIWQSAGDANLLFTLMLAQTEAPTPMEAIPLRVGLGVCRFLEQEYGMSPRVKWPNDVLVDSRKICGVLCEARRGWIAIGIGLNCNQTIFAGEIRNSVTSISTRLGVAVELDLALAGLLKALHDAFGAMDWRSPLVERLYRVGEGVTVRTGKPPVEATVVGTLGGIGPQGQLLVLQPSRPDPLEILSGEIVMVPKPG